MAKFHDLMIYDTKDCYKMFNFSIEDIYFLKLNS